MSRTQITLCDPEDRIASARSTSGCSRGSRSAEYIRRLVREDIKGPVRVSSRISLSIFDLGNSGGSDIANHKDEYIGDAVDARNLAGEPVRRHVHLLRGVDRRRRPRSMRELNSHLGSVIER